eukprot:6323107-Prorocentrum_lima.AAC.1
MLIRKAKWERKNNPYLNCARQWWMKYYLHLQESTLNFCKYPTQVNQEQAPKSAPRKQTAKTSDLQSDW